MQQQHFSTHSLRGTGLLGGYMIPTASDSELSSFYQSLPEYTLFRN